MAPPLSPDLSVGRRLDTAADAGNVNRATDLLREHLASVGCDPLALRIVNDLRRRTGNRDGLEDFSAQLPDCHRARNPAS